MADEIKPTPKQYPMAAGIADALRSADEFVSKPFGYENPPGRILSDALGVPAVARTLDRVAYGEPLTTGKGQTTMIRPDTTEAVMSIIPMASAAAKYAPKAVEALGPKVAEMSENYLRNIGGLQDVTMKHVSPHSFSKFDSAHIGKGEGNQSFGQGLYFTDSDEVERYYVKAFSKSRPGRATVDGTTVDSTAAYNSYVNDSHSAYDVYSGRATTGSVPEDIRITLAANFNAAVDPIAHLKNHYERDIKRLSKYLEPTPGNDFTPQQANEWISRQKERLEWLKNNKDKISVEKRGAKATKYEVDFADEKAGQMMDWNSKIGSQSEDIRKVFKKLLPDFPRDAHDRQLGKSVEDLTGENAYRMLSLYLDKSGGAGDKVSDLAASKLLVSEGVPGHKYKPGTAGGGSGKSGNNYVVYPGSEDSISILKSESTKKR